MTRAAVWKAVEQLRDLGVALDAQTSKGYRLGPGVSALSPERIEALLAADLQARIEALLVEWALESTNTRLLESLPPRAGRAAVVLAENQTGGRGRRGRAWLAPPGGAICLSLAWLYPDMPADLSALSLIVGLAAVEALTAWASPAYAQVAERSHHCAGQARRNPAWKCAPKPPGRCTWWWAWGST